MRVAVFGAGAFGGWTALALARRGARVTLIDPWGPGNARATSGGETRVIRATYGTHAVYTAMAARALDLWRDAERAWQQTLLRRTGVLWLAGPPRGEPFIRASAGVVRSHGIAIDDVPLAEARRRFPQIAFDDITTVFFEPDAGYLFARQACEQVASRVVATGGEYRSAAASAPVRIEGGRVASIPLVSGGEIAADHFVFACGPWLARLFPDLCGPLIEVTRQEVLYFGTPPGDERFGDARLPVWIEFRDALVYGIPEPRGFKVADDTPGPPFDPTHGDRDLTRRALTDARRFLASRFPDLASAPLTASEVCQYESTPDANFLLDRHPEATNVWIAGGGSGHGFKMGPAVGEVVSGLVLDGGSADPVFSFQRFANPPTGGWPLKWS